MKRIFWEFVPKPILDFATGSATRCADAGFSECEMAPGPGSSGLGRPASQEMFLGWNSYGPYQLWLVGL